MPERWCNERWICVPCGKSIDVRVLRDTDTRTNHPRGEELAGRILTQCNCKEPAQ